MNISHRDIKPENFMLLSKNDLMCVKVIDFGLSKDFAGQDTMHTMSGSPYYIAPEVFLQEYTHKIDIWSLGVVLYIMLSGKVPFPGNSELEIIGNVIKGDFHFNHDPFKHHSQEAKDFLMKLICKDVELRCNAVQALEHPWIQKHSAENAVQDETMQSESNFSSSLAETKEQLKGRKVALLLLCQRMKPIDFESLQNNLVQKDAERTGILSFEKFEEAFLASGNQMTAGELKVLKEEIDTDNTNKINYDNFLSNLFMTRMFLK